MSTWSIERRDHRLAIAGELRLVDAPQIWRVLRARAERPGEQLDLDLSGATVIDGAVMSLIVAVRGSLNDHGVRSEIVGAPAHLAPIVHLYGGDRPVPRIVHELPEPLLARLGAVTLSLGRQVRRMVAFGGEMVVSLGAIARRPAIANWPSLPPLIVRGGFDGIPIVMLLNFLIGFVMAFQSLQQLRLYGADIYVADIVGISVSRELGPLLTAVIVSGRSGAAFAAELGTMRVSEEIDALRTMGFAPIPYLVVPRILALAIVSPVLTLVGDIVGVLGGMFVAATSLDITPHGYFAELQTIIVPSDVWTGLIKSVAFGAVIAFIGCQQGLSAYGSASAVGRATTATVVYSLFTLVIVDTLFTVVFLRFGW